MLTYSVLLLATLVGVQAEEATDCCCLSKLEAFMGTWEVENVDIGGKQCTITAGWRHVLDGKFIEHQWAVTDAQGNPVNSGLSMIGHDPTDEEMRMWGYTSDGEQFVNTLSKHDGAKFTWVSDDGDGAMTYDLSDEGSLHWALQKNGQDSELTLKNVGAEASVSCPARTPALSGDADQQLKEIAWWAGDCTMEGSDAFTGKSFVGQTKCGWILDGQFLLYDNATVDDDLGVTRYRAVVGVDPATDEITGWEFDSTASVGKYTVTDSGQDIKGQALSPDVGLLKYKGRHTDTVDGFEYRAKGELPGGKKIDYHGIWKKKVVD